MTRGRRAAGRLRGRWGAAFVTEALLLTARLLLPSSELLLRRWPLFQNLAERLPMRGLPVSLLLPLALDWLLISPLLLGRAAFYREAARGGESRPAQLFCFFGRYGWALRWRMGLAWRKGTWMLLCLLPAMLVGGAGEGLRRAGGGASGDLLILLSTLASGVLAVGGVLAWGMLTMKYLPSAYLLAEARENGGHWPARLFRRSGRIMRGNAADTLWFCAGFAGWFLLCAFLPVWFYAAPLYQTARAGAAFRLLRRDPGETDPTVSEDADRRQTIEIPPLPAPSSYPEAAAPAMVPLYCPSAAGLAGSAAGPAGSAAVSLSDFVRPVSAGAGASGRGERLSGRRKRKKEKAPE